jgi:hypothetical protein
MNPKCRRERGAAVALIRSAVALLSGSRLVEQGHGGHGPPHGAATDC